VNGAPEGGEGVPLRAENPYAGVGTVAQVALRRQDLFGNTTVTPFQTRRRGTRGRSPARPPRCATATG
jgi:hypothetical protein